MITTGTGGSSPIHAPWIERSENMYREHGNNQETRRILRLLLLGILSELF
jgi:hypothetical protein